MRLRLAAAVLDQVIVAGAAIDKVVVCFTEEAVVASPTVKPIAPRIRLGSVRAEIAVKVVDGRIVVAV